MMGTPARKQGIYVNDERVAVEANGVIFRILDRALKVAKATVAVAIWSRGTPTRTVQYENGQVVEDKDETLSEVRELPILDDRARSAHGGDR